MLKPSLLQFVTRVAKEYELDGPLLTLGVQDILASYEEAEALIQAQGVTPIHIPAEERQLTTALLKPKRQTDAARIHARTFFRMLGIRDYYDLDASTAERPGLVHDLNTPVPPQWHRQFNWILDGGTLEHVFDIRTALANLIHLSAVGGHVMHINPATGWVNHGFYQFSPCLYYDFYQANGFRVVASFFAQQRSDALRGMSFSEYQYTAQGVSLPDASAATLFIVLARKVADVGQIAIPVQRKYAARMSAA